MSADAAAEARMIVDDNVYMTLATADEAGAPWASPVYFAHDSYRDFVWISKPGARHSGNIGGRPAVGIVIFDSRVPPGTGRGVYLRAEAAQVPPDGRSRFLDVFNARFRAGLPGVRHIADADVTDEAPHRLYSATVAEAYVLDDHDERIPVSL